MTIAPDLMTASVLTAPGSIELHAVATPTPGPGQVLVRITAIGVCGSDTHFYETGAIGDIVVRGPLILGHESAGEIVATGANVPAARVGTLVSIEPQFPCRRCGYCKDGRYHLCGEMRFYGAWPEQGAFAEYAIIDDDFAHAVPASMTAEQAALVEPVSVAVHANRRAGVTAGSRVLISGAGPIGTLTAQVARAFGAVEVVVSDPVAHRRDFAARHGASAVVDPRTEGLDAFAEHFDVYIDASGNAGAILSALPAIRAGGMAVLVGMGAESLNVPIALIQHREITLTGTFRYVNTWPLAIELVAQGTVEVTSMITGRYGLDGVDAALRQASSDPTAIKSMVLPALTRTEPAAPAEPAAEPQALFLWRTPEMLFDMDGTLLDSIPAVEAAWRVWAQQEGVAVPDAAQFHGRTALDLVSSMVPPERLEAALTRLQELERNPSAPIRILPGALELVGTLPADRWSIVTSAASPVAEARLRSSGFPRPSLLVSADAVSAGKPDPEPFLRGSRWRESAVAAIGVEDTIAGLQSAAAAGCRTIGVVGTHTAAELLPHADVVVHSLHDISVSGVAEGLLSVQITGSARRQ